MASCEPEIFGADPAVITWQVVRGDTAELRVQFLENDEVTFYDTSGWSYASSAYDFKNDISDELEVIPGQGYVDIIADSEITQNWGSGYASRVAELAFDLQVTTGSGVVWTPVVGTISVLGDVTGGI